jgi:hypothetical protein
MPNEQQAGEGDETEDFQEDWRAGGALLNLILNLSGSDRSKITIRIKRYGASAVVSGKREKP